MCQRPNSWIEFLVHASNRDDLPRTIRERAVIYKGLKDASLPLFNNGNAYATLCDRVLARQGGAGGAGGSKGPSRLSSGRVPTAPTRFPSRTPSPPLPRRKTPSAPRKKTRQTKQPQGCPSTRRRLALEEARRKKRTRRPIAPLHAGPVGPLRHAMPGAAARTRLPQTVPLNANTPLPLSLSMFSASIRSDARTLLEGVDLTHHPNYYTVGHNHGLQMVVHYEDLRTVALGKNFADEVVDGMSVIIGNTFSHCRGLDCNVYELASRGQAGPLLDPNDPRVTQGGYEAYQPVAINVDLQGLRYIFVPINQGGYHWVIVAYDIPNQRLLGYDPLFNSMLDELNNVERILRDANLLGGPVVQVPVLDMPQQNDGTSCGPAIVAYMLAMARGTPLPPLSNPVVEVLREFFACSILSNSIGDSGGSTVVPVRPTRGRQHVPKNLSQANFEKAIRNDLPMDFLMLTRAEATARAPRETDRLYSKDRTGSWVFGFMPGQAVPFDWVMYADMNEEDCLTFTDGNVHVGKSYVQWGANLMSEKSEPQPNASDMEGLLADLTGLSNPSEMQQDLLLKLQRQNYRNSLERVRSFPLLQAWARGDQKQARLLRQIFKYMFYLTMFYRRWRGPGHNLPLTAANTKQTLTSPSQLSQNIPGNLRHVLNGRASGIDGHLIFVIMNLTERCHPLVKDMLLHLPLLDIGKDFEGLPVPFPLKRSTHTNQGLVIMRRLWAVFELTAQGQSCVRETSHLVARSANFYFALVTGFPLVPYEDLESMAAVV
jgi:hypothetical protein